MPSTLHALARRVLAAIRRPARVTPAPSEAPHALPDPLTPLERRAQRFSADELAVYDFATFPQHLYVTSEEWKALHPMNLAAGRLIDDKGLLPVVGSDVADLVPSPSVYVMGPRALAWSGAGPVLVLSRDAAVARTAGRLASEGRLFFRLLGKDGGVGAALVESVEHLQTLAQRHPRFVVTPHLRPAAYSAAIWPDALNTIRVYAFRGLDETTPILRAFHRFGRPSSGPVDNNSAGGVICGIDLATGVMGRARYRTGSSARGWSWHVTDLHPDSGSPVRGVSVPDWDTVWGQIERILAAFDYLCVAGFDVALTSAGLRLVEINSLPSAHLAQMDQPLLLDERFRVLFEALRAR